MVPDASASDRRNPFTSRAVFAGSTIVLAWLFMQVIHESGHVLGAMVTGGKLRRVVVVPWELSRTDLLENPRPLLVCWAGPLFGAVLPVVLWLFARSWARRIAFWLRFLAGFCLIANGAYIGVGGFTHDGDAGDLLREGSPLWGLLIFGAVTVPFGLILWHGLAKQFGFGCQARPVTWHTAWTSLLGMLGVILVESICAAI